MLDKDLATLYGVETRTLNQAVKRNIQRFPADFRFQLTIEECSKSQIVTLNAGRGQNIKKLPYGKVVIIPNHHSKGVEKGTYYSILRQAGLK